MMTVAWFIRHGESRANAGQRTPTPSVAQLTPRGQSQAALLPDCFAGGLEPSLLVTTPYVRTAQTAAPTGERFPRISREEWPLHEFAFLSPVRFYNSTVAERRPALQDYWQRADPEYVDGEGAESFASFIDRVRVGLAEIQARQLPFVVIFSHGFVIRAVAWLLLSGASRIGTNEMRCYWRYFRAVQVPNAAILKLRFPGPGAVQVGPLVTSHLPAELQTY